MKKCNWAAVCVIVTMLAIYFNFPATLMGSPANLLNMATTLIYVVTWGIFVWRYKHNFTAMLVSLTWWSMTCLSCAGAAVLIYNPGTSPIFLILIAIFMTPLYSIYAMIENNITGHIVLFLIGLAPVLFSIVSIWRIKHSEPLS